MTAPVPTKVEFQVRGQPIKASMLNRLARQADAQRRTPIRLMLPRVNGVGIKEPVNPKILHPATFTVDGISTEEEFNWNYADYKRASNDSGSENYLPDYFDEGGNKYDGYEVFDYVRGPHLIADSTASGRLQTIYCKAVYTPSGYRYKTYDKAVHEVAVGPCDEGA